MVNPNDERLLDVESKGQAALDESNAAYDSAIKNNTTTQTELLDKIDANTAEQKAAQQAQSDLAIQKIEQNKEWAKSDYLKEQKGAYVDWQKQSDPYGVKAEQMAANGLANTGYAESSQVAMYTAYQNRIATAREAYTRAVVSYDTAIAEAKATNSVALAEIASKALEQSLNIAVQFAMQNNSLLVEKAKQAATIKQNTLTNYMTVYGQLQDEAQHNESMAWEREKFNASLAEEQRQFNIANELTEDGKPIEGGTIGKDGTDTSGSGSGWKAWLPKVGAIDPLTGKRVKAITPYGDKGMAMLTYEDGSVSGVDVNAVTAKWAAERMKEFETPTYEYANAFLKKYGASDFNLMTKNEWTRRKASYKQTGIGKEEVSAYNSYADYLKNAVEYAITKYNT